MVPLSIVKYIRSMWMAENIVTYLHIDEQDNLAEWSEHSLYYGLSNLTVGQPAVEQLDFLEGLLSVPHSQVLPFVQIGSGKCAHVHIIPSEDGTWILLFDATAEHDRQQTVQQRLNELLLLSYRQSQLLQELELARQRLVEEKQQLEIAGELKSRFIASLSHELRTPLTSIVGYTKLLEEIQQQDVRESSYLASVKSNANHLLSLIDNVLEQAKLEVGQVVLRPTSCDVKQLLADLQSLFFPHAREKGLKFETQCGPGLPTRVTLDELRFRQILINLITNALKFTKHGFVRVTLDWQDNYLEFAVADSGPGISRGEQERIFSAFYRENSVQSLPGAGLGLSISHHLVSLMEGTIKVESSLGQGSVFSGKVFAPLANYHSLPATGEKIGLTILVADDSLDLRTLMQIYLEDGGYQVITAQNGEEAVSLALQMQPALILMDMQMPIVNGYLAVQQLRERNFRQPIIALSGSTLSQDQNYAYQMGCNHYLIKPVRATQLLEVVTQYLAK